MANGRITNCTVMFAVQTLVYIKRIRNKKDQDVDKDNFQVRIKKRNVVKKRLFENCR